MTQGTPVTTVIVNVAHQGNYFIATSNDVPGLHVWGDSEQQICERVMQSIKLLFKWNRKLDVEVFQESDPATFPKLPERGCNRFVVAAERA